MSTAEALLTIVGLAFITLLTRVFFVWPDRELPLPTWLREGLRYAPVGALLAVVAPDFTLADLLHCLIQPGLRHKSAAVRRLPPLPHGLLLCSSQLGAGVGAGVQSHAAAAAAVMASRLHCCC